MTDLNMSTLNGGNRCRLSVAQGARATQIQSSSSSRPRTRSQLELRSAAAFFTHALTTQFVRFVRLVRLVSRSLARVEPTHQLCSSNTNNRRGDRDRDERTGRANVRAHLSHRERYEIASNVLYETVSDNGNRLCIVSVSSKGAPQLRTRGSAGHRLRPRFAPGLTDGTFHSGFTMRL